MELFLRPIPRLAIRVSDWDNLPKALMGNAEARIQVWDVAELDPRWNRVSISQAIEIDSWFFPWRGTISLGVYKVVGSNKTRFFRAVTVAILARRFDLPFPGKASVPSPEAILGPSRIECGGIVLIDGETEETDRLIET